ncbi:peptidase domain-containing ABC transporter [Legionella septentrionalis]|nr:peptidase domain-containing ABC transporter [Legionella septentrionalis]RUR11411.1 peptidase domain-containing ABC transporter [Legionella septentrionalis]
MDIGSSLQLLRSTVCMTNNPMLVFKQRLRLPLILQDEAAECGHACVAMVSNYWGHELDMHAIRKLDKPTLHGVTLATLKNLFEKLGFAARALKVPLSELALVKCPAILHWNLNHFVVLKKVNRNSITIYDPAMGIRHCNMQEASASFTGILLEVEKSDGFEKIRSKNKLGLLDLVKSTTGIQKFIVFLLLLSLSIEILGLLNPLFIQYVTDSVLISNELNNLLVIALAFSILLLLQIIIEYTRGHMVIYLTNHLTEQFSSNVLQHLLHLPLNFFEQRNKGDILSKFQSIDQIQKKISTDFVNTVLDGFMIFINVLVMFIYNQVLTFFVLGALSVYVAIRYATYQFVRKQSEASIHLHAKTASIFLETLQGILPVKSFLKERLRLHTWRNSYIQSLNADIKVARMQVFYQTLSQFLFHLEHLGIICLGAYFVFANKFSIGMLMAFLSYRLMLINKASSFIQNVFDYKLISIQLNRLGDIVFQQPECIGEAGAKRQIRGSLLAKQVSFKYSAHAPYVLQGINFEIKAGEKVAIIGPSGCGKSTLLKILMGLFTEIEGEILVDGMALGDFGLKNYRELTASVMQEDTLLTGSILENISFFEECINMDALHHAAKTACIHEVICQLPMGYETLIGEMGAGLSGGQKQRLLLARALYKNPKILFLDEATSHLDVENEKKINQALKELGITQIIVAHRQETIDMADRVIDLNTFKKLNY